MFGQKRTVVRAVTVSMFGLLPVHMFGLQPFNSMTRDLWKTTRHKDANSMGIPILDNMSIPALDDTFLGQTLDDLLDVAFRETESLGDFPVTCPKRIRPESTDNDHHQLFGRSQTCLVQQEVITLHKWYIRNLLVVLCHDLPQPSRYRHRASCVRRTAFTGVLNNALVRSNRP